MKVCPKCGMGPEGITSEDDRDECENCGYSVKSGQEDA